jgi:hypothetical protein
MVKSSPAKIPKPIGRPLLYSKTIAQYICQRLAEGESLDSICAQAGMPRAATVRKWANEAREGFDAEYARARSIGYEKFADEVIAISDAPCMGADGYADNGLVQKQRLQVESRKWLLSKMLPKQYGDKVTQEITGEDGGALITRIELVAVDPRPRPQLEHDDNPRLRKPGGSPE